MNRAFIFKVIGIFLLTMVMSWAVMYINSLISERQNRQNEVKQEVAKSSAGEQTTTGPILVVPYIEEYAETTTENGIKKTANIREQHWKFRVERRLHQSV